MKSGFAAIALFVFGVVFFAWTIHSTVADAVSQSPTASYEPTPTPRPPIPGDADCDGRLEATDALIVLRHVADGGHLPPC